jgi:hypothetical protein
MLNYFILIFSFRDYLTHRCKIIINIDRIYSCKEHKIQSKLIISMVTSHHFPVRITEKMIRFERNNRILASGDRGCIIGANYFFHEQQTSQ